MTGDLKPIETQYKGYRFRSRLEARWAVFFDALGIEWIYEPEGFDLGDDVGWYLPDFWLPTWNAWVDIKPSFPDETERTRMWALSCDSRQTGLIFIGDNFIEAGCLEFRHIPKSEATEENMTEALDCCCEMWINEAQDHMIFMRFYRLTTPNSPNDEFMLAHKKARSARFEHGETPK